MNAIRLLRQQHREVEELFKQFEGAGEGARQSKEQLCQKISDALAVHATIEEKIFYPATKSARTEEQLLKAVEEHLAAKRIIADLLETELDDEHLDGRMKVLKEEIAHHVAEEERQLFPQVQKMLDRKELDDLGDRMQQMADDLVEEGEPRMEIPKETGRPAPL